MTQLTITFLGTGGTLPSKRRGMPSFCISFHKRFLFDVGEGTQRQMMKFGVPSGSIHAVFISHLHLDHYLGLLGLLETYRLLDREKDLLIFAPEKLRRRVPFHKYEFARFVAINKEGVCYEDELVKVSCFSVDHGLEQSYGFRFEEKPKWIFDGEKARSLGVRGPMFQEIQKKGEVKVGSKTIKLSDVARLRRGRVVVYSGDTRPLHHDDVFSDVDLLIHDSTYSDEIKAEAEARGHSTAKQAGEVAKRCGAKKLALFHISNRYQGEELLSEARAVFPNTVLPEDGFSITINKPEVPNK